MEEHFRILHEELDLPIFAYDIPVCVHTKLPWRLLAKLGAEGVLAGVKDSSGDDISFRYLCQENEKLGHPLSLLTGHEIVVDGAYLSGADGSVPGLGNVDPDGYVRMWKAAEAGDWSTVKLEQDKLNELSHIFDCTDGVQGYGAGVGAFKTASCSWVSLSPTRCFARSRHSRARTLRRFARSSLSAACCKIRQSPTACTLKGTRRYVYWEVEHVS